MNGVVSVSMGLGSAQNALKHIFMKMNRKNSFRGSFNLEKTNFQFSTAGISTKFSIHKNKLYVH